MTAAELYRQFRTTDIRRRRALGPTGRISEREAYREAFASAMNEYAARFDDYIARHLLHHEHQPPSPSA